MLKDFHGKVYYLEIKNFEELHFVKNLIMKNKELKKEVFYICPITYGLTVTSFVIYSEAKCGEFRGEKYSAWEKVKSNLYVFRKERA